MDSDLIDWLSERCNGPIDYGVTDCAALAAGWIKHRTGHDPMAAVRPLGYDSKDTLDAYLTARGGLVRWVLRTLGKNPNAHMAPPHKAHGPCVGIGRQGGEWFIAIWLKPGWWAYRAPVGIQFCETAAIKRSWECQ